MKTFLWFTNTCAALKPSEMTTLHLFHSVRMLWNHTVAPKHQLQPFREWNVDWDADFRAEAMTELTGELKKRTLDELTLLQRADLKAILKGRKVFDRAVKALDKRLNRELMTWLKGADLNGDWQSFHWGDPFDAMEEEDFRDGCPNT